MLFIDELDRCRPEFATKLLEQTKGLFQQENVIVVYSTDKIQLANALEGLYGSSYDRLKYLERFHDFEFALTPVAPISYLEAKGVSVHSSYFFMKIAMAYIAERECPPRTCNRFVEKLNQGKAYIDSMRNNGSRGDWVANLSKNALLPTFIAMAEFEPLKWDKVRAGADFKFVFEFAKTNLKFIEYLDSSISEGRYGNANSLTDSVRKNCVEDVCALIFLSDHSDKRFEDARKRAGSWWDFDTEICRSLIFPDVKQKN